ncbi:MAG: hypothetical protein ABSH00_14545 [Bryobacteraceae bacterium]|jgi:hypothetical protein
MNTAGSRVAVKVLPSLADIAFLMPVVLLFGRMDGLGTLLGDGDTGWHIRTGEWILAHHAVPYRDLFSFSKPDGIWYAWEWLADVIFAGLNGIGGLAAVSLFAVLLIAVIFALVFRLARRKSNAVVAILVTVVAMAGSSIHWLARPHLFTLLFAAIFLNALERVREGHARVAGIPWLVLLPVLTVLWSNLHGGFLVGVLMIAVFGAAELLQVLLAAGKEGRAAGLARAGKYLLSALACLAASLLNPYTYHLHVHVWQYLRDPFQADHIMEFLSMSFHQPQAPFFEAMLAGGVLAGAWCAWRGSYTEPLLVLLWAHAALVAGRHVPIFMIVAAPMVAAAADAGLRRLPVAPVAGWLQQAAAWFNRIVRDTSETDAIGRWHLVSLAGVALLAALLYAPHPPKRFRAEFDPKRFPAGAVNALARYPAARVFTYDQWGDYLIYRLYPQSRVFVDGRSDFYGDDFETKLFEVLNVNYGWDRTLARFGVDTVLMPPNSPLTGALKESCGWLVVYDDGVALVFRARGRALGDRVSAAAGGGSGRDREVTKTLTSDRPITELGSKT